MLFQSLLIPFLLLISSKNDITIVAFTPLSSSTTKRTKTTRTRGGTKINRQSFISPNKRSLTSLSWIINNNHNNICNNESSIRSTRTSLLATVEKTESSSSNTKGKGKSSTYGAGQITVLEGLDPVRKRPGM